VTFVGRQRTAHAGWLIGGYTRVDDAGQPVMTAEGRPQTLFRAMPSAKVHLMGNWEVLGLVATASYDYEVRDQPIDPDLIAPGERAIRGGALYAMGLKVVARDRPRRRRSRDRPACA
jgi:hypothetical protein